MISLRFFHSYIVVIPSRCFQLRMIDQVAASDGNDKPGIGECHV